MSERAMISAIQWVPKGINLNLGYAKRNPQEYDLTEQDINDLKEDPMIKENMMEEEEEDFSSDDDMMNFASETNMLKGKKIGDEYPEGFDEISDEEKEDYTIKRTDAVVVGSKIQGEYSTLEVYVYEEDKCNLFVHHEIVLSAFPLCMEHLPIDPFNFTQESLNKGNFLILGTFLPEIEIWNLDILNTMEPSVILGEMQFQNTNTKTKKLKPKQLKAKTTYTGHQDAVMSLSLNQFRKNILCSGSADTTIKLWDITQKKCLQTYNLHKDKVQIAKFNPSEESVLFSAGFDRQLKLFDAKDSSSAQTQKIASDIESAIWNPLQSYQLAFTTEDGHLGMVDARKFTEKLYYEQISNKTLTSVCISPSISGLLATTSLDGYINIFDINQNMKKIATKNMKAEKLYCGQFNPDNPWLLGCGSGLGEMVIWDLGVEGQVNDHFKSRSSIKPVGGQEQLIEREIVEDEKLDDDEMEQEQQI